MCELKSSPHGKLPAAPGVLLAIEDTAVFNADGAHGRVPPDSAPKTGVQIIKLNIPTGVPLVYELDEDLKPIKHYYLGDADEIAAKAAAVAAQGKKK